MKKLNLLLGIILAVGMVLAASCGSSAPAPTATVTVTKTAAAATVTAPPVTVTAAPVTVTVTPTPIPAKLTKVTYALPAGAFSLFFNEVGKAQGFFEKRGIDLELKPMATDAALMAAFVGQADIGGGDILPFYTERKDARIIGPWVNFHYSVLVRKDSPYKSYQDLKGKKIATPGPATGGYQGVKVLTRLEGLDLEKDFQLIIGEFAVQTGWLLKGEVEAIHIPEPLVSQLLLSDGDKVRELYWLNDLYKKHSGGSSWMYGGVFTTDAWAKKNPDLAKQVGLAYDDTFLYIYGHDQVWTGDLAKKVWKTEDKVLGLLGQRMPATVEHPPYGPAYKAALVKKTQFVADAGLLPKEGVEWLKRTFLFAD